jgi:hypothetical protein
MHGCTRSLFATAALAGSMCAHGCNARAQWSDGSAWLAPPPASLDRHELRDISHAECGDIDHTHQLAACKLLAHASVRKLPPELARRLDIKLPPVTGGGDWYLVRSVQFNIRGGVRNVFVSRDGLTVWVTSGILTHQDVHLIQSAFALRLPTSPMHVYLTAAAAE